jgi:alkylation response protein AidB-like acyl-CoA dehydrogenase
MTAVTGMTCQPRTRLRPPRLAALPDITAALAARAAGHDRDCSFPEDGISLVHDAGLLTATVAARYGGAGAGLAATVRILRALGRGDPSVALITAMTLLTHAMQAYGGTWPRRIYEEVLQESAGRPVLINALRVDAARHPEPAGGRQATVARWHSGTWWLSGRKIFSTGAAGLRWIVVWAPRTDARGRQLLVRTDSPGISIRADLGPSGPAGRAAATT